MRVDARDLERAFQGNGEEFEPFINDLVRASARACGISSNLIDWDTRPSVRDGGRDLVVRAGNPLGPGHFIPDRPSLWSLKSGADGVDPEKLKKEILQQPTRDHPKVRQALRDGQVFVWCAVHPVGQDKRDKMRETAEDIARDLAVSPDLIEFRWQDRLVEEVNRFPNVIPIHLPDVEPRWAGVRTLDEWREPDFGTPWAEFGSRAALIELVERHLLGRGTPNVLHIAGLSGIGKSRTVFEACQRNDELHGVFYLARSADLSLPLERSFRNAQGVLVVIDETPLEEIDAIAARFGDCADRVRIVTIGPASRQRAIARRDIVVVPEPENENEVLAVIRTPGTGLSEEVLRSIAARSAHDLRLALMLVRASHQDPDLRTVPLVDFNDVWNRVMRLFRAEVPDPTSYRRRYEVLTVGIDVGIQAELRSELQGLAEYFGQVEAELLDCLNVAADCGLGLRPGRFFEATPHALALGLFRSLFSRQLRDRLSEFMGSLPPRLLRRFLERCQECPEDVREEVAAAVGGVFLEWLGGANVTFIAGREASRVYQAWAEFDPVRGLAWLRAAVDEATPEQLLELDGDTDGSGGWRGRRQVVWMCQNLACFAEHYADCEAILFRLARHETEPQIGNNSVAVWQSLFWPVLSQTEVPFGERFPILLRRLRQVTSEELPLVLSAAFGAIEPRLGGLPLPPRVIGGRIVPAHWTPDSHRHWHELRRAAAGEILDIIADLPPAVRDRALDHLVDRLRLFRDLGLTERVRTLFPVAHLAPELRRKIVIELDREIEFHRRVERRDGGQVHSQIPILENWKEELAPSDLATRVQDLTARDYYDVWAVGEKDAAYEAIADELIASPEVFRSLAPWFESPSAKGVGALGFCIGKRDTAERLAVPVREWLATDRCRLVVTGYLNGVSSRESALPPDWVAQLDALVASNPELAVVVTSAADVSSRGLERVLGAINRLPAPASQYLRVFGYGGWYRILGVVQQQRILEALLLLSEGCDPLAPGIGMDLIRFWGHERTALLDEALVPAAFRLAARAPSSAAHHDAYNWRDVVRQLCPRNPAQVAELIVAVLTARPGHPWRFDDDNIAILTEAGRLAPEQVMEVIGRALLDPDRRGIFGAAVYTGLFDAIGVNNVRRWVDTHGSEYLRWIARHFASPQVDDQGQVVVPPLTEWLFTNREGDQRAFEWFLMGRHSGAKVWTGDQTAETRAEMEPYLQHPLRRVREWAEYEIRSAEREADWFRQRDEEGERL